MLDFILNLFFSLFFSIFHFNLCYLAANTAKADGKAPSGQLQNCSQVPQFIKMLKCVVIIMHAEAFIVVDLR